MRYVTIDRLESNAVLAKPIYDENGRVLLGMSATLSNEVIKKLEERGFPGCYIEDDISKDIFIEETIPMELRNQGVDALRKGNIDAGIKVAKSIVEEILNSGDISLDMVDLRTFDDYTFRHSINVAVLSTVVGMGLQLNRNQLEELCIAAVFHDIGKRDIPIDVLNKPSKLTQSEFDNIKKHSQFSYDILKERKDIASTSRAAVLYHHENEDGSGYPSGLEGKEIHLYAKIIHVSDVYDALISKRPYKMPYALSEAIEYIMGGSNILFDQKVVKVFLTNVPVYPVGIEIALSDGRGGIVIRNNGGSPLRPVIRLYNGEEVDLNSETSYRNVTVVESTGVDTDFSNEVEFASRIFTQKRKDILLVSENSSDLRTLYKILQNEYNIFVVKNGIQVLEFLKRSIPELIIMDIDLPGMDGLEVTKVVHERFGSDIPIIFRTSRTDRETVIKSIEAGVKDYITKPYKEDYILERVKRIMKTSKVNL